jgi:hypothetical protein
MLIISRDEVLYPRRSLLETRDSGQALPAGAEQLTNRVSTRRRSSLV